MVVDDPAVVAEVRAAFEAYESALLANDVPALDDWFWRDERTVRVAFGDVQLGASAIGRARRAVDRQTPPRTIERLVITTFGADTATATAICRLAGGARIHQSQMWVRVDGGRWRVVTAHVSRA